MLNFLLESLMTNLAAVILAAGKGTRMKSDLPKVLYKVNNKPMVHYSIDLSEVLGANKIIVVVGYGKDQVIEEIYKRGVDYVIQEPQLGTGHAVMQAEQALEDFNGDVLVFYGDVPMLSKTSMEAMLLKHRSEDLSVTILTATFENPFGYGRIIRNEKGNVVKIVEQKDASESEQSIREINSGIYVFKKDDLFHALKMVKNENVQSEYYLTDVIEILGAEGKKIDTFVTQTPDEIKGVNTIEQLAEVEGLITN
jgi:UDP-N-acetylglucosamine diphosphorylase/glucosamine-1-phosphate N-acetyltransferase